MKLIIRDIMIPNLPDKDNDKFSKIIDNGNNAVYESAKIAARWLINVNRWDVSVNGSNFVTKLLTLNHE